MSILGEFARHPRMIGTVAASSTHLAAAMLEGLPFERAKVVVEYGPGTGAITRHLLRRLPPAAQYFAVELNAWCVREFARQYPGRAIYQASVADVAAICARHGVAAIDIVVSSLPWASFQEREQGRYLDATARALSQGGHFVTYAYVHGLALPAGRTLRRALACRFRHVDVSPTVWRNLPPAVVYRCRAPRHEN
jgi:phospholipid N-methyltransferase